MLEEKSKVRLGGDVWLIPGRRGGRYPHCNSLLINSGPRAVIDPGANRLILRELAQEGVGQVLLSHHHSDHLRELRELSASAVWVHESEKEAVESFEGVSPLVWFPDEIMDPTWIQRKQNEVGGWGWPVAGTFWDGDEIVIGDVRVVVLHCPGHTRGHSCFWLPEPKILYSADIDLTDFGPWYGNAASNISQFRESIQRLKSISPEITVTGHEAGVIHGGLHSRLDQYAQFIEDRHQKILGFITRPRTHNEIVAKGFIYGDHYSPDNSFHAQEWRMVRHHLFLAIERGELIKEGEFFIATGG